MGLKSIENNSSRSFIYYVINLYVPRVRANAYHALTTPPRVFGDPKMCLRNIWTAPNSKEKYQVWLLFCFTKVLDSLGLRPVCKNKKLLFLSSPALYSYPGPADLGLKSSVLPARPRLGRELNFFCLLFVTIFVISNIKWPNALKVSAL